MDHGNMGHGDMGHGDMGHDAPMCNMNMLFTWDTTNLCIVFQGWRITNAWSLIYSLVLVALLTAGYEAVREASRRYDEGLALRLQNMPRKFFFSFFFSSSFSRILRCVLVLVFVLVLMLMLVLVLLSTTLPSFPPLSNSQKNYIPLPPFQKKKTTTQKQKQYSVKLIIFSWSCPPHHKFHHHHHIP